LRTGVPNDQAAKTVQMVNNLYGTSVFLVVFAVISTLPILFLLLPEYEPVATTLTVLLLAQAILSMSFGYNCLAIARKQQLKVALISLTSVLAVTITAMMVAHFKLDYAWIATAVLFGTLLFTVLQSLLSSRMLTKSKEGIKTKLPLGGVVASIFFFVSTLADLPTLWMAIGIVVFVALSWKQLESLWNFGIRRLAKQG
jgi:hypothetical protein